MRPLPVVAFGVVALFAACGGGGGGSGSPNPPQQPNESPSIHAPAGLSGTSPSFSLVLPVAGTQSLVFTASDPEGAILHWQLGVDGAAATASGLSYSSPVTGSTFVLDLDAVAVAAAVSLTLLVEDPVGGVAAIDLSIVRSGAPAITAIAPSSAFAGKSQTVTITGSALQLGGTATTTVAFDGLAAVGTTIVSDTTVTCSTPTSAAVGPTVVGVANQFGSSALPGTAFTLFAHPPALLANDTRLDAGSASGLELTRDGDAVHAVWNEGPGLVYRLSSDRGATWSSPITLSGAETATEPTVIVHGDDVAVAWVGDATSCLLRRSTDGGQTFAAVQRLDPTGAVVPVHRPRLAISGARSFAAWISGDAGTGQARVRTVASSDLGVTWTAQNTVHDGGSNQSNVHLAADGSDVWLLYEDASTGNVGVFSAHSTNAGTTWPLPERRSAASSGATASQLAQFDGRLYAAWVQNGALRLTTSGDRGASWSVSTIELQGAQGGVVSAPTLVCTAQRAYAAYIVAGTAVRVATFTLVGATVRQTTVEQASSNSALPQLAVVGNYVFVAWREGDIGDGSARVLQAVSTDSAQTFPTPAGFGDGAAAQDAPRLAVDGAHLLLGWTDSRDATSAIYENHTAP